LWLDVYARRGQIRLINLRSHGSRADSGATFLPCPPNDLLNRIQGLQSEMGEVGEDCAMLFGQEVWSHPRPAEIILALDRLRSVLVSGGKNVWLNPVYQGANSAGAMLVNELQDFGSAPAAGGAKARRGLTQILEAAAQGKLKALLVVDADILNTYPDRKLVERALHSAQTVVYCGPFAVPTAQYADVLLPLGTWAHREGTVVSLEWRVQKRLPGQIDSVSPSALDLANNLANHLSKTHIAADIGELYLQLGERVANWPLVPFVDFPQAGVRFAPQGHQGQAGNSDGTPAVVAPAKTGAGLRLIRKRFLYNDRQEIVNSPVFGQVWKPFCAFVNPADAQELKLNGGEVVRLGSGNSTLELPVKLASWVIPGTVIINDLCHAQPANTLAGAVNVTLEKTGKTVDPATVGMKNGGHAPSLPTIDTMNSMAASGGAE
jgi:anaerobic selenocysteine-containing dehydrogenase